MSASSASTETELGHHRMGIQLCRTEAVKSTASHGRT